MIDKIFSGYLSKMVVSLATDNTVVYSLRAESGLVPINDFVGKQLTLTFEGKIQCVGCNRSIKKTYQNGYCFPCTQRLAACDLCIVSPDRCHYHKGTCREPNWGEEHCFIEHYVYLSNTSGIKVGLTRNTQIPTRWIDQGAVQAIKIAKCKSRRQAGLLEKQISTVVADKTNWRKMLQVSVEARDLEKERDRIFAVAASEIQEVVSKFEDNDIELILDDEPVYISYPYDSQPEKIKSIKLDKVNEHTGKLLGIKGQYLIFDNAVINIRTHTGYDVSISQAG